MGFALPQGGPAAARDGRRRARQSRSSTRPRAAGCICRPRRWSRTRCGPRPRASAARRSRSAGRSHEDVARLARGARGGRRRLRNLHRRQPGLRRRRGDPPRATSTRPPISAGSRSRCRPTTSTAMRAFRARRQFRSRSARASTASAVPRISAARRLLDRAGRRRAHRRHHAVAEDRASRRDLQRRGLPAFPDGAACRAVLRRAQRALARIYPAARRPHRASE